MSNPFDNLGELVDAVEVGEGDGDTLGHGLLTLTDPDAGVVEPGRKLLVNGFFN